jgi:hypothetical protein
VSPPHIERSSGQRGEWLNEEIRRLRHTEANNATYRSPITFAGAIEAKHVAETDAHPEASGFEFPQMKA